MSKPFVEGESSTGGEGGGDGTEGRDGKGRVTPSVPVILFVDQGRIRNPDPSTYRSRWSHG